jgi:hypothetical protein
MTRTHSKLLPDKPRTCFMNGEYKMNPHHESDTAKPTRLADDLIWEVSEIAAEIGLPTRVAYNMLRTGKLPAQKCAAKWVTSRAALRKHFASIVAGEVA